MLPKVGVYEMNDGLRLMLFENADQHGISGVLKINKKYEPNLQIITCAILSQVTNSRNLVLDIGANLGSYVVPIACKYEKMRFICFEPQPSIFQQLCGNLFLNSLENVEAMPIALGRKKSAISVTLPNYADDHNIGAFTLIPETQLKLRGDINKGISLRVPQKTLDSLEFENIALIKIDVEGAELDVLQGGIGTLHRNLFPPIIYEAWDFDWYAPQKAALEDFLKDMGYSISNFDGSLNFLAQHPKHGPGIAFKG